MDICSDLINRLQCYPQLLSHVRKFELRWSTAHLRKQEQILPSCCACPAYAAVLARPATAAPSPGHNSHPIPSCQCPACLNACSQSTTTCVYSDWTSLAFGLEARFNVVAPTERDPVAISVAPPAISSADAAPVPATRSWGGAGGSCQKKLSGVSTS